MKHIASVHLIQPCIAQTRVPQNIALVGFDDFELTEVLGTPMTVVRQFPEKLARTVAEL